MNKKELKQMKREIALRPLSNWWKNYAYETGRTLIGGTALFLSMAGIFTLAGVFAK